jgi:DNA polymerase elongation subunit (family B)/intein/homing endonuclease
MIKKNKNIRKINMEKHNFFTYSWHLDEDEEEITSIRIYGVDEKNENVCIRVNDFTPYVYIELPEYITTVSKAQLIGNKIDEIAGLTKPLKKTLVMKKKLYYAQINKNTNKPLLFPYLCCSFSNQKDIRFLSYKINKPMNILGIGIVRLKMHEQNANPILQLTCCRDIPTAGWVTFDGKRMEGEDKLTLCNHEFKVRYRNLNKYDSVVISKPLIMGFDIEVNSTNPSAMPNAEKHGDKVFQISCIFAREGCDEKDYEKILLSLGKPDINVVGKDSTVIPYDTEADLLMGFTQLIRDKNPNIIVGYNILGFDIPYMIKRAKLNLCLLDFDKQGFTKYTHAKETTIIWSSSAYKNQKFEFLDAEGRLFVDLLPLVRRDFKLSNYKLKTVADHLLGTTKDPLSVKGIFKCYRIGMKGGKQGSKALGVVGKYCLVDGVLCVKLMEKMKTWVGLCEMARTCVVPPFYLYTKGQQIKVFCQIYKFCFSKDTDVSLVHGTISIVDLVNNKDPVLSWDEELDRIVTSRQLRFFDNGTHDCITLEFEDNRTITCTPNHLFATADGVWVAAGDLKINSRVKVGPVLPKISVDTQETILARILGFILTDGHISKHRSKSCVYMSTLLDANNFSDDIAKICGYKPKIKKDTSTSNCYTVSIPVKVEDMLKNVEGIEYGNRTKNANTSLPIDLMSWEINRLREFLAGMFGGDGWSPSFAMLTNSFTCIGFTQSRTMKGCVIDFFDTITGCLNKFDIQSRYSVKLKGDNYVGSLVIQKDQSMYNFVNKIGYRYCLNKTMRASVAYMYYMLRNRVIKDKHTLFNNIMSLVNGGYTITDSYNKAIQDISSSEYMPSLRSYTRYVSNGDIPPTHIVSYRFVKVSDFIQLVGATDFFISKSCHAYAYGLSKQCTNIPTFTLKLINRKEVFEHNVYDIEVENTHSFLANGLVVHNCMFNNFVVEKDAIVVKENERYVGAHVFEPKPGIYDRVVSMDFSSLYPTTIIAYNICWSTFVKDDSIPDEDCHVFSWHDHVACCVAGDTSVSLDGMNMKIENLEKLSTKLLTWDEEKQGLTYSQKINFYNQGVKDCIQLTLEDGRTLTCTPDHKVLCINNIWKEAGNLTFTDKVVCGISYPEYNIEKEIQDHKNWDFSLSKYPKLNLDTGRSCSFRKLDFIERELKMDSYTEYNKSIRIARLMGLLITDGTVDNKKRCTVFSGHKLDIEIIQNDIHHICGYTLTSSRQKFVWSMNIPVELSTWLACVPGVVIGNKMKQPHTLPEFICDPECPTPIVREFLSGLFSGDGCTISLNKNSESFGSIGFVQSSYELHSNSVQNMYINISKLLKRFGISCSFHKPQHRPNIRSILHHLYIPVSDIKLFSEKIGFRYCVHKSQRLTTIVSYINMRNNVLRQCNWVVQRSSEIRFSPRKKDKRKTLIEAVQMAHAELKAKEPIFNEKYSLPDYQYVVGRLKSTRHGGGIKPSFRKEHFPSVIEYLENINAIQFFLDDNIVEKKVCYAVKFKKDTLPTFTLGVIHKKHVGKQQVYDIEVDKTHNFIGNGIVVHNCHDPKVIKRTKLTEYINVVKEKISAIRERKNKTLDKFRKKMLEKEIDTLKLELDPYIKKRSDLVKTKPKFPMCEKRYYRFLKKPKGIMPTVIQNLLDARKRTKVEIKTVKKQLNEEKEEQKIKDLSLMLNVLDKRQLAYKVSANSMYGIFGFRKGLVPLLPGAMCVCYMGRINIGKVAETIVNKYKAKLIYGDSVTGDTPILIRYPDKTVDIKTIETIGDSWESYDLFKAGDSNRREKQQSLVNLETWTDGKWTPIKRVIRHKTKKRIFRINTHTACIDVTEDHSLITDKYKKIKPNEVKVGNKLLHSFPDKFEDFIFIPSETDCNKICEKCKISKEEYEYYDTDIKSCAKICKECHLKYNSRYRINSVVNTYFSEEEYLRNSKHLLTREEAFVFGFFFAAGSCGQYPQKNTGDYRYSWAINNQNLNYLNRAKKYLEMTEPHFEFKILDTMKSSGVYKLVCKGRVRLMVKKYRPLFYDQNKYKKVPYVILNAVKEIREWFAEGYWVGDGSKTRGETSCCCKGKIGAQGLYYLFTSLGENISINTQEYKPNIYWLSKCKKYQREPTSIKKIVDLGYNDEEEYVYDLEANGMFHGGVGNLIIFNTDSNYLSFPHLTKSEEIWDHSIKVAAEITKMFPKPINLEFESAIYWRYLIVSKKRYMYKSCGRDGVINNDMGKKGVLLARRDNSKFIRDLYEKVTKMLFEDVPRDNVLYFIIQEINKMCSGSLNYKNFIITKAVGDTGDGSVTAFTNEKGVRKAKMGQYTIPLLDGDSETRKSQIIKKGAENSKDFYIKSLPAQVQLAEKMRRRGQRVDAGSRLEYVITETGGHTGKQYMKIESSDYYKSHGDVLKIDYIYYLKQLTNPMDQLLNLAYLDKEDGEEKYKYKKDFVLNYYKFILKVREPVLKNINKLIIPKFIFEIIE